MRSWRTVGTTLALSAALIVVSGCSRPTSTALIASPQAPASSVAATSAPASADAAGPVRVGIKARTTLRGGVLTVSGTTQLVDASVIGWEVGRARPGDVWEVRRSGKATVEGGRFSFRADVNSIPGSTLYVFLVFSTDQQPQTVRTRYGEVGENLRGSQVELHGDNRTLEYWLKVKR